MSYEDASNYYQAMKARGDILSSGDLVSQARELANWEKLKNKPTPKPREWTFKDVIHGIFGAGLGAGLARGASAVLGLGSGFADKLETAAMGVGAAMNTGAIKWASADEEKLNSLQKKLAAVTQQRRHAFRLGFLKGAQDSGLMKKEALMPFLPVFSVGLGDVLNIPRAAARAVTGTGRTMGHLAGTVDAPDATEEELTQIELQRTLLQEQLDKLRADKRNKALREVLANRGRQR